jgi:hypothetical protein
MQSSFDGRGNEAQSKRYFGVASLVPLSPFPLEITRTPPIAGLQLGLYFKQKVPRFAAAKKIWATH